MIFVVDNRDRFCDVEVENVRVFVNVQAAQVEFPNHHVECVLLHETYLPPEDATIWALALRRGGTPVVLFSGKSEITVRNVKLGLESCSALIADLAGRGADVDEIQAATRDHFRGHPAVRREFARRLEEACVLLAAFQLSDERVPATGAHPDVERLRQAVREWIGWAALGSRYADSSERSCMHERWEFLESATRLGDLLEAGTGWAECLQAMGDVCGCAGVLITCLINPAGEE